MLCAKYQCIQVRQRAAIASSPLNMQADALSSKSFQIMCSLTMQRCTYQQLGLWGALVCLVTRSQDLEMAVKGWAHHLSRCSLCWLQLCNLRCASELCCSPEHGASGRVLFCIMQLCLRNAAVFARRNCGTVCMVVISIPLSSVVRFCSDKFCVRVRFSLPSMPRRACSRSQHRHQEALCGYGIGQ